MVSENNNFEEKEIEALGGGGGGAGHHQPRPRPGVQGQGGPRAEGDYTRHLFGENYL